MTTREERFRLLCETAACCALCPRLTERQPVLSEASGPLDSPVVFVAEAPGRLGADVTGVPLKGDRTGHNFDQLLGSIGWSRDAVFITNAVLCNPRLPNGTNATPDPAEVRNCADYLAATLEIVDPAVVVPLGAVALRALAHICQHRYELSECVAKVLPWGRRHVFPLYHPGPRAQVHRSQAQQARDFYRLAELVDLPQRRIRLPRRYARPGTLQVTIAPTRLQEVISYVLGRAGRMSRFKLTKLLYLIDYAWLKRKGRLLSEAFYISQKAGPFPTVFPRQLKEMEGHEASVSWRGGEQYVDAGAGPRFVPRLAQEETAVIDDVLHRYVGLSDSELRTRVYLTAPMRRLLRRERAGKQTHNKPVFADEDFDARQQNGRQPHK